MPANQRQQLRRFKTAGSPQATSATLIQMATSISLTAAQTLSSPEERMSTQPRSNPSCDPIPPLKKPVSVGKQIPNGARCPLPSSSSNPAARPLPRSCSTLPRKNWLAINSPAPSTLPISYRTHPLENSYAENYRACYKPCTNNERRHFPINPGPSQATSYSLRKRRLFARPDWLQQVPALPGALKSHNA